MLLAVGAGEPGAGLCRGGALWLGAGLWLDEGAEGEDDGPPPPGVVPSADGDGATWAAAPAVAFAELPAPLHKADRRERPPQTGKLPAFRQSRIGLPEGKSRPLRCGQRFFPGYFLQPSPGSQDQRSR